MIHPVFRLIATRPQLLADHLEAYAEMVTDELGQAAGRWKQSVLLHAIAICSVGMAGVLGGVALMFWAVTPAANIQAPWALFAAPALPVLIAVGCIVAARAGTSRRPLAEVATQVRADMAMFREASAA